MCGRMAISIGIPVYNAEPYLADAIRSVFAQSYSDWELIIIDDGSTDQSLDIAMSIDDPRVRVISDGRNMRLPYRLNQIVRESRYEYVARMDADDLMSPFRLEKQFAILADNSHIDLVSTGVCSITNNNVPVGTRSYHHESSLTLADMIAGRSGIVHASVMAKKDWFLRNPYDETQRLTEDYELWLRAFLRDDFNVFVMRQPYYYYREDNNVTADKMLRAYESQRQVVRNLLSGYAHRIKFLSSLYMKSLIVFLMSKFGGLELLRMNRNTSIDDRSLARHFALEIDIIRNAKVPGLD